MQLQLQVARGVNGEIPTRAQVESWVTATLKKIDHAGGEVTVRVVGKSEMTELNERYRGKCGATNVLSFSFAADELPHAVTADILGDVVICAPVVADEAASQGKPAMQHWAHMVIHGVLHLCGFDHQHQDEAEHMEWLEQGVMKNLGIFVRLPILR